MTNLKKILTVAALGLIAATVGAADDYAFKNEIGARKALMHVYSFNLGILGAMAKGEMDYDGAAADVAAGNLVLATQIDQSAMWPAGSDAGADGLDGKTRAKPELWSTYPEVSEKHLELSEAVTAMAADAGVSLDALRANMKAVGEGCKGCHESYRVPKKK